MLGFLVLLIQIEAWLLSESMNLLSICSYMYFFPSIFNTCYTEIATHLHNYAKLFTKFNQGMYVTKMIHEFLPWGQMLELLVLCVSTYPFLRDCQLNKVNGSLDVFMLHMHENDVLGQGGQIFFPMEAVTLKRLCLTDWLLMLLRFNERIWRQPILQLCSIRLNET